MSKHRHGNNNNNNRPQQPQAPVVQNATPGVLPELPEKPVETTVAPESAPAQQPVAPENAGDVQKVLAATAQVQPARPQPVKVVVQAPTKAPVVIKKENRVMAEQLYPSQSIQQRRTGIRQSKTPMGQRLAKLFEEYKSVMSQKINPLDQMAHRVRAKKLFEVFTTACPNTKLDSMTAADLVRVSFDSVMDGWGTVYTDGSMFRMDYTLPTERDIDRVDMFFTAIIQLVEGVMNHRRVMFDRSRLSQVIANEAIVSAIIKMKDGVNNYNQQRGFFTSQAAI